MDFEQDLKSEDKEIFDAIERELHRQQNQIELIASENIVSRAVLEAQGSILTNKYAEGYCGKRYYGGCEFIDEVEALAIERAKSCSTANMLMFSRIPVLRQIRRFIWLCLNRMTLFWGCLLMPEGI